MDEEEKDRIKKEVDKNDGPFGMVSNSYSREDQTITTSVIAQIRGTNDDDRMAFVLGACELLEKTLAGVSQNPNSGKRAKLLCTMVHRQVAGIKMHISLMESIRQAIESGKGPQSIKAESIEDLPKELGDALKDLLGTILASKEEKKEEWQSDEVDIDSLIQDVFKDNPPPDAPPGPQI